MIAVSSQKSPLIYGEEARRLYREMQRERYRAAGYFVVAEPRFLWVLNHTKGKPS